MKKCGKKFTRGMEGNSFICKLARGHEGQHGLANLETKQLIDSPIVERAVERLLSYIGEEPQREGLRDTPRRFVKALEEMTIGYKQDPAKILERDFDNDGYDQIILCSNIELTSLCEHHISPFLGHAWVAYLPNRRVVGLSKMARLVDCFARRLQIQERLTKQIADAMMTYLKPRGVVVMIEAKHLCMCARGVGKKDAGMITSEVTGVFRNQPSTRAEAFQLIQMSRKGN